MSVQTPMVPGGGMLPVMRPTTITQNVASGVASTQSDPFGANTEVIRIVGDQDFRYQAGSSPTASNISTLLPAGVVELIHVDPGWRIACIQATAAGTVNVTEML